MRVDDVGDRRQPLAFTGNHALAQRVDGAGEIRHEKRRTARAGGVAFEGFEPLARGLLLRRPTQRVGGRIGLASFARDGDAAPARDDARDVRASV